MLFLLFATRAEALSLGSSLGFSPDGVGQFPPSFDLDFDSVIVQIRATETLAAAFDNSLFVGANIYATTGVRPIGGVVSGVVEPGGGVVITGNPTVIVVSGQCRLGAEAEGKAGFGAYVVPEIGLVTQNGDANLYAGGALQLSVWFGLGG